MNAGRLLKLFDRVSEAPDAIAKLRRFVLDLAVRGKLVDQDPADEPAHALATRMREAKARVLGSGRKAAAVALMESLIPHDLPRSWAWVALGDIFIYDAASKHEPSQLDPERWLLELEDIEKDTSRLLQRLKVCDRDSLSTKAEFVVGDVLYSKLRPYLNKVIAADRGGYCTTEIVAIRSATPISAEYCCLALKRTDFVEYVERLGRGTKMPRLRTPDAIAAPFPLPPLAEQRRIIARVDELMTLCDQLEAARVERERRRDRLAISSFAQATSFNRAAAEHGAVITLESFPAITARANQIERLRHSILDLAARGLLVKQASADVPASEIQKAIAIERTDLVQRGLIKREKPLDPIKDEAKPFELPSSWVWSRIGEAVLFTQYGTSQKSNPLSKGVPVLTMGNIQNGLVVWNAEKKIPDSSDELPDLYLRKFDILYNRTNSAELVGKTGIYLGEDDARTFASYLIRLRPSLKFSSPQYINIAMNTPSFRKTQIAPLIKQQTGQANVNGTALKNMLIPLPPLAEQHRIVARVEELMTLCDQLEAALIAADTVSARLLDAILHGSLNGTSQAAAT